MLFSETPDDDWMERDDFDDSRFLAEEDPEDFEEDECFEGIEEFKEDEQNILDLSEDEITNNSLKKYLREIGEVPLLTPEEEIELTQKVAQGDKYAKDKLIRANLRLVVSIAKHFCRSSDPDFLDIIQEGNLGLMKAAERFDPSKGFRFSTYATWWIKQAVRRGVKDQKENIHYSYGFVDKVIAMKRYREKFYADNERYPTLKEVGKQFDMSEEDARRFINMEIHPLSIDSKISPEDDASFVEILQDSDAVDPEESSESADAHDRIFGAFRVLTEREQFVLISLFGLGGGNPRTLEDIGSELGVTRERVRQIKKCALEKLKRNPRTAQMLKSLLG